MSEMMIKPEEITASLRKNLEGWEPSIAQETVGYVSSIADGVARVKGLPTAMASELLEFPGGLQGIALNVDEHDLGVVLMGESNHIEEGDPVKQTGKVLSVPVGDELLEFCDRLFYLAVLLEFDRLVISFYFTRHYPFSLLRLRFLGKKQRPGRRGPKMRLPPSLRIQTPCG